MPLVALVRWMLKNVVDVGESSTDLEEIGKRLMIREDTHKKKKSGMYATSKSCDDSGAEETRKK